ncbi:MAG: LiaF transmembrane domain-containing protein [Gammaproteobacteria bacterium]
MDNRELRRAHREWSLSSLGVGLVIIVIGIAFLLYNFNVRLPFLWHHNWWALFILIGAIGPLAQAGRAWHTRGGFDANVLHSLTTAAIIVTIALFFLFSVSWNHWWPVFLIYGGLWTIARRAYRRPDTTS